MVMLMMGFFVILFALNVGPKGGGAGTGGPHDIDTDGDPDMIDFAIAVRAAFNNEVDLTSDSEKDMPLIRRILQRRNHGSGTATDKGDLGQEENVKSLRPSDYFRLGNVVLFDDSSTRLNPEQRMEVATHAEQLKGLNTVVEVRGHTGVAEARRDPERSLKIAFDRAMEVARELNRGGVDWRRMRITTAGDTERANPSPVDAAADRANSRVEIVASDELAAPRAPKS